MNAKGVIIGIGLLAVTAGGATWALMDRDAGPDIVAARMEPVRARNCSGSA